MKILSNKKYNELIDSIDICHQVIEAKEFTIKRMQNREHKLEQRVIDLYQNNLEHKRHIDFLSKELTDSKKSKGGYKKQINQLHKVIDNLKIELEDTNKKLEESMTDKYLVKKIPSGKRPKTIYTKISDSSVQSKIVKNMYKGD